LTATGGRVEFWSLPEFRVVPGEDCPPPPLSLSLSRALSVVVGFLSFDSEKAEERIDGFANEGRGRGGVEIAVGLVDLVGSRALVKPAARLYG